MKRTISLMLILVLVFSASIVSFAQDAGNSMTFSVTEDKEFGSVEIDASKEEFARFGAELGDSIDVRFSSGYMLEDIPYYDGYYERVNRPLVVNYPGLGIYIAYCSGDSMWKLSRCAEGDRVNLTIREKGKYLDSQNAMASVYVDDRDAFDSDEAFANFRAMTGGNLRSDMFFRGASPVDNAHKRAGTANSLIEKKGIRFVLNLADSERRLITRMAEKNFASDYAASLYDEGKTALLALSASYRSDTYKALLVDGLLEMMKHEGPYYIHCTEGKDRTGFVCMLLEALADASYEEIEADYMRSYDNYYGITEESDGAKYNALKEMRLYDMLWWLADLPDGTELVGMNFRESAENYLRSGGMTDQQITELENFLTQ